MEIRTIQEQDAEAFLRLRKQIAAETPFMLRNPDEIVMTVEQQRAQIQQSFLQDIHLLLIATQDEQLVGFLMGIRGEPRRKKHTLTLVIGILQAFTRQGIGTQLLVMMEQWSRRGITRLELHVLINNQAAIALYKKRGFEIEGVMKCSQYLDGCYVDEYLMAKILS